jgi:hypothetical protein
MALYPQMIKTLHKYLSENLKSYNMIFKLGKLFHLIWPVALAVFSTVWL